MENSFLFAVCVVITLAVTAQGCSQCGTSGACCEADETCESTVDAGTCYKTADKIKCNSRYHCYKPRICCGYSSIFSSSYQKTVCCPENSKCCDGIPPICCPLSSRCGTFACYSDSGGSNGSSGTRGSSSSTTSSSRSSFAWYYIFIAIPVIAICVIIAWCLRLKKQRAAQAQRPSIISSGFPAGMNTLHPGSSPSTMATYNNVTYGTNLQPPVYTVPTQTSSVCDPQSDVEIPEPPAYSEIVDQSAFAERTSQTTTATVQTTENVNMTYQVDRL